MKTWYNTLPPRDRLAATIITVLLLGAILWFLLIKPLFDNKRKLTKIISTQESTLQVMKKQTVEIKRLQVTDDKPKKNLSGNPQQLIERALQTWRLKPQLERMQSQGANGVRLVLKNANADRFMRFLYELEDQYALTISNLTISNAKKEQGFADIRLTVTKN